MKTYANWPRNADYDLRRSGIELAFADLEHGKVEPGTRVRVWDPEHRNGRGDYRIGILEWAPVNPGFFTYRNGWAPSIRWED